VTGAAPPRAKLRASVTDIHSVGARRFASANGLPGRQWVDGTEASETEPPSLWTRRRETGDLDGRSRENGRERETDPSRWRRVASDRRCCRCYPSHVTRTRDTHTYTRAHVPVVRRTPDIEARHIHDREREAREDRGDAVVRVIGTPFRGLHNSITPMSVACVALHCGRGAR